MSDRFLGVHHRDVVVELIAPFLPHRLGLPVLDKNLYAILSQPHSIAERALRHYSSYNATLLAEARRTESGVGDIVMYLVRKTLRVERWMYFFISMVKEGNAAVVGAMLRAGVGPIDSFTFTIAVSAGHAEVTRLLLDFGAVGDVTSRQGEKALIAAAANGHVEVARLLLERGANVHARGESPIQYAAERGHLEMVKLLVECGAYDASNFGWQSLIQSAVLGGNPAVVEYILDRADVPLEIDSMLYTAMEMGRVEAAKVLLDRGAIPNDPRLLHFAVFYQSLPVTKCLLDHGIGNPSEEVLDAALARRTDILDLLIERGADIHVDNDIALRTAATSSESLEAV